MEFTKEEIKTAKTLYDKWASEKYTSPTFKAFLDSLLKPETKFINVRIEYDDGIKLYGNDLSAKGLECYLTNSYTDSNTNKGQIKVTELPEVFTREEVLSLFNDYTCIPPCEVDNYMNDILSERKSK